MSAIGYSRYLKLIYALGDLLLLNLAFAVVSYYNAGNHLKVDVNFLSQFLYINFFWIVIGLLFNINDLDRAMSYGQVFRSLTRTVIGHCMILAVFNSVLRSYLTSGSPFYFGDGQPVRPILNFPEKYVLFVALLFAWRSFMMIVIYIMRKRGMNYRRVIIVGGGNLSEDINNILHSHPEMGYRMMGVFTDKSNPRFNGMVKGTVEAAKSFSVQNDVDEIYCSISELENEQVSALMHFADKNLIRFKIIPDFRGFNNKKVRIDFYESIPVLSVRNEPLQSFFNRFTKRSFDILFSATVLVVLFPVVFLILGPLIYTSSKGGIFFRQQRSGRNNKPFTCYKFRTMVMNEFADEIQAGKNDPRITSIGKFLRTFSLDELPQFFNVLIGNMTVVGPRPHMLKHTEDYSQLVDKFMVRHFVKPGITGWAQVNGLRGETTDTALMEKRVEHDVWYIENWSLMLDLKIIFLTAKKVLRNEINGV